MSIEHHSEDSEVRKNVELLMSQFAGDPKRAWPRGQIGCADDGATAYAIAADPQKRVIVIRFPKPMYWIGLDVDSARVLRDKLDDKINDLTVPKSQ